MANELSTAAQAIETRLLTAFPTTPLWWQNVPFTPTPGAPCLQARVLWGAGEVSTMRDTRRNIIAGVIQVRIYTPTAAGAGALDALVETVRALFNRAEFGGVRCFVPSGGQLLETLEGVWQRATVTIPITVDEVLG